MTEDSPNVKRPASEPVPKFPEQASSNDKTRFLNAVSTAISEHLGFVPLTKRYAIARATLDAVYFEHRPCGHCGGQLRGNAEANDVPVCHPDRGMDCYLMVTVWGHDTPCSDCSALRQRDEADSSR